MRGEIKMMQNTISKERMQNLDIARTFAIFCVVICHCIETAYTNIQYIQLSNISQIFRIIFFTIGRLGVPIFLFLTGALILKKQIENDEDVNEFYKRNLLPLFLTIEIWNIIYNIFLAIMNQKFNIRDLFKDILFFKQVDLPNMWYMPMILGMYIVIPFVAKIVKTFSLKTLKIPIIFTSIVSVFLPSINVILYYLGMNQYKVIIDVSFLGGIYGLYILIGYYIKDGLLKKYNSVSIFIIFIITCIFQYFTYKTELGYNVWYDFITLFISSVCIFELFTRIPNKENENILIKITKYISKISLGIFFLHEIFLNIFVRYTSKLDYSNPLESMILFLLSIVCSIVFIYLSSKVKFIREKIFLIK